MKVQPWFERRFDFTFPVERYPCIVERLRGTPARIEELTLEAGSHILSQRLHEKWSVLQHTGHLFDLDQLHIGRLEDYRQGVPVMRPADLKNTRTEEANHNSATIQNLTAQFRAGRSSFLKELNGFDDLSLARVSIHPRLQQPMRLIDMAYFVAEHDDHHLAHVTALLDALR